MGGRTYCTRVLAPNRLRDCIIHRFKNSATMTLPRLRGSASAKRTCCRLKYTVVGREGGRDDSTRRKRGGGGGAKSANRD